MRTHCQRGHPLVDGNVYCVPRRPRSRSKGLRKREPAKPTVHRLCLACKHQREKIYRCIPKEDRVALGEKGRRSLLEPAAS